MARFINGTTDKGTTRGSIDRLLDGAVDKLQVTLVEVLKADFVNDYMNIFGFQYDSEFLWGVNLRNEDPTSPQYIKPDVVEFIHGRLNETISALVFSGDSLEIKAIPDSLWPTPSRKETDKVRLFYFYLHGTPNEYVGLSRSQYKQIYPGIEDKPIGRYGSYHLVPLFKYKERYAEATPEARKHWPLPNTIRHPFSGAPPSTIFDRVFMGLEFDKYIQKTIRALSKS